jgi:hypothetical protein
MTRRTCAWCGRAFTPRSTGGKEQRFCRPDCRRAFDAAGRRWIAAALAADMLTHDDLRNGSMATRALHSRGNSPAQVPEPQNSASVAPTASLGDAGELLDELLSVPSEGWRALAAAMSEDLFDRLKRWRRVCLMKNQPQFPSGAL